MPLDRLYPWAARPAVAGVLVLLCAAVAAGVLGGALPDDRGQNGLVMAGWGLCALATCLVPLPPGPRARAVLWVLIMVGAATAYGGLQGPAFARPLTLLLLLVAFVMAVLATLLSGGDDVRT